MSINGNGAFCTGSSTYSITGLPCNATVAWSVTPTGIITPNTSTSLTPTFTKVTDGTIMLSASVNSCNQTFPALTKPVSVGAPTPSFIPYGQVCSGPFTLCANAIANSTSRQWVARVGSSNITLQETSDWCVEVPANTLYVDLFVTNSCGTVQKRQMIRYASCLTTVSFEAYPNPSTGEVNVRTLNGKYFKKLKIFDKMGNLHQELSFLKGTKSAMLNLTKLIAGVYRIQAFDGEKWTSVSIIKQ